MANDIAKKITQPVDTYLKFVQQTFNTSNVSFMDIFRQLDTIVKLQGIQQGQRIDTSYINEATRLRNELNNIQILKDISKYNKFNKLGNLSLSEYGLREVYKTSNDIIKDINVARHWIDSYKKFSSLTSTFNIQDLHSELILLGKSILGRAIEMCPMKTGYLRSTGVLMDFGTYIVIAFLAPYATYVHENLEIKHPNHASNPDCGGRAKFLERAVQEFFPDRAVWTENLGQGEVAVKISINPLLIEYTHYSNS